MPKILTNKEKIAKLENDLIVIKRKKDTWILRCKSLSKIIAELKANFEIDLLERLENQEERMKELFQEIYELRGENNYGQHVQGLPTQQGVDSKSDNDSPADIKISADDVCVCGHKRDFHKDWSTDGTDLTIRCAFCECKKFKPKSRSGE